MQQFWRVVADGVAERRRGIAVYQEGIEVTGIRRGQHLLNLLRAHGALAELGIIEIFGDFADGVVVIFERQADRLNPESVGSLQDAAVLAGRREVGQFDPDTPGLHHGAATNSGENISFFVHTSDRTDREIADRFLIPAQVTLF